MRFCVRASVGNADGVFDAAYDFGHGSDTESGLTGTPEEIGAEVARFLSALTPDACDAMRYGTDRFFIEFIVTPAAAGRDDNQDP